MPLTTAVPLLQMVVLPVPPAVGIALTVTEPFTLDEIQPVLLLLTVNTNGIEGGVPVVVKLAVMGDAGNVAFVTGVMSVPEMLYKFGAPVVAVYGIENEEAV